MKREIVLDTETTGLDPNQGHRLVEIGCVELSNHIPTGEVFHTYLNPQRDVPLEAFRVHNLSTEFLSDKALFADIADAFLAFIGDSELIIHNAAFDLGFLNFELERINRPTILRDRVTDTLLLARRKHPGGSNNLDALCKRYGIDNSRRTKHGALLDSEILAEVYLELIGARQTSLGLSMSEAKISSAPTVIQGRATSRPRPGPLPSRITEADVAAHGDHISTLGDTAIWLKYAP